MVTCPILLHTRQCSAANASNRNNIGEGPEEKLMKVHEKLSLFIVTGKLPVSYRLVYITGNFRTLVS